jgi:hypothetical protein
MTNANSMSFMKRKTTFAVVSFILSCTTVSLTAADTPESRRHEAERYLQAVPPKALFEDMAEKMSANMPPGQRTQFKAAMTSQLDVPAITKAMTDAMVKHFSSEELKALADFYGSPSENRPCKNLVPICPTLCLQYRQR